MPLAMFVNEDVAWTWKTLTIRWSIGLVLIQAIFIGSCKPSATSSALAEDEVLHVEDPDPDQDKELNLPKFCNPTGKTGTSQTQCYEFNDRYYQKYEVEAKEREPWFNFAHDNWLSSHEIEEKYVIPVVNILEAVNRLEQVPLIDLSLIEVKQFSGKSIQYKDRKPYLVRGLTYYKDNGKFSVFEKEHAILVRHDSHGEPNHEETRFPVILWLPYKPSKIYVDCQLTD